MIIICVCTGFVSNGEFNYLRTKGYTRPLSVLQVRTNVKNKYAKIGAKALSAMLTPKREFYSYVFSMAFECIFF